LPNFYTLKKHDSNTISIKTIGYKRSMFTVMLDYMVNRLKLPFIIIFKLKNKSQEDFSNDVYIRTNTKKWVNKEEMIW